MNDHPGNNGHRRQELEIPAVGQGRWLRGLIWYLILVAGVASLLVYLFVRFTGSLRLAVLLVAFMLGYMGVMGWLASRRADERDV
jgi:hypothetical protein